MTKELEEIIRNFILDSKVPLPKTKTIDQAVDLFINGARSASWNHTTAQKFTNKFEEKKVGCKNHFYWVLQALNKKFCFQCSTVKSRDDFHGNSCKLDGKQGNCIDCYQTDQKENPERWRAYTAARRAQKISATPKWANLVDIADFYENCPNGYHVDHIVPLQGQYVCGLHVINNLQYLPALDNLRKSNKFQE